jgi:hypothetical protein
VKAEVRTVKTYTVELTEEEYRIISYALALTEDLDMPGAEALYDAWTEVE